MRSRNLLARIVFVALLTFLYCFANAQGPTDSLPEDPGGFIFIVTKVQDLNFGAFSRTGSGGTLTLSNSGMRSASGGVMPLNLGYIFYQAIFDIETNEGVSVSILNGPDATLTGSNGGTMTMRLGNPSPEMPFVSTVSSPGKTRVYFGGTLTIGNASSSPPGNYQGSFDVTFHYD